MPSVDSSPINDLTKLRREPQLAAHDWETIKRVLKETYPARPAETMKFLLPRAPRTPRLVLRLAAEKMSAQDRARILGRGTRRAPGGVS